MNYLEIRKLIARLDFVEETLKYRTTPSLTSVVENTPSNIKRLEQEKEDIKFQLEFPYLLFELLTTVEDIEKARVHVYKRQKDNITAIGVEYNDTYDYIRIDEADKDSLGGLAKFISKCKEEEFYEKEQKKKEIEIALGKLTNREKELLNITNLSDKNSL